MKKIFCLFLCLSVVLASAVPLSYAAENETDKTYPTIMIAGYSSTNLYLQSENGPQKVWGVDGNQILTTVLKNIARIGRGLGELAFGRPEYISDLVGGAMLQMYDVLAYTPNGKSVYPILPYAMDPLTNEYDVSLAQDQYLLDFLNGENIHEYDISMSLAALDAVGGNENMFSFQVDFRQNIVDSAADLDRFIDAVLEYTGKEQVNIFAVSHGGEIAAVYLHEYGAKNKVHNAVLTVPAIGGAALAYDVVSENVILDEETLLYFIENGNMLEADINWLVRANRLGILDDVCNILVRKYVKKILGNWGSMWDFIPAEYYDELKARFLSEKISPDLIEKSDYYHYEILPTMGEALRRCVENGAGIYIVAGSDLPSVTGLQVQSDAIIPVSSATGAQTSPYGLRFHDGYLQKGTVCADPEHNHLSPAMTIDASTAFLPEQTWFVNGMYHGMTWKEPYARALCCMLLASEEIVDVHSFEEYPQFKFAENNSYSVLAYFDCSEEGYVSGSDKQLIVKNLSNKYPMRVLSVNAIGADLQFDLMKPIYIAPGKTKEIRFTGSLPEESLSTVDLTVTYALVGNVTPIGERTYTFTLNNGPAAEYTPEEPYEPALKTGYFENVLHEKTASVLQKTGWFDFLKMIVNMMVSICNMLKAYCRPN